MTKQKRDKKMAVNQFAIYEVVIKKGKQTDAFMQDQDPDEALKQASAYLGELFTGQHLNLSKTTRIDDQNVSSTDYENDVLAIHDGVYLLRVHNNKKHKMTLPDGVSKSGHKKFSEFIQMSYPYCYAVVDNRTSPCLVSIQKNSAFGDPKNVHKILQAGLNQMMSTAHPLEVELFAKTRESKIWEFCRTRCKDGEDSISRISFDFPNLKDYSSDEGAPQLPSLLMESARIMELTEALKMHIEMDYSDADPGKLEAQTENLAQVVRYCGRNTQYKLHIKFREYGDYRIDDKVRALFPMDMKLLKDFIESFEELPFDEKQTFGMIDWCDQIKKKINDYQNAVQIPTKRHRKSKKSVQH